MLNWKLQSPPEPSDELRIEEVQIQPQEVLDDQEPAKINSPSVWSA